MLARIPFAIVADLTDIDSVLQEVGERTVGERDATVELFDLGIASLGDDASSVEVLHQFRKALHLEIALEALELAPHRIPFLIFPKEEPS